LIYDYVIIGAGISGLSAASSIAEQDPGGRIALINGEKRTPYKRTKISKNIRHRFAPDAFLLNNTAWYTERAIDLKNGTQVEEIDISNHRISLSDSTTLSWNKLIIAAGAKADSSSIGKAEQGRFTVRCIEDVEVLQSLALNSDSALVVGMGVLGVEVSEQLQMMGLSVTLVGTCDRLMEKQLNDFASEHLKDRFDEAGVRLLFGHKPGETLPKADIEVHCVGSNPDVRLARDAGIVTRSGVVVNDYLETSAPDVYAAGDVTEREDGTVCHLWHEAEHQGRYAGLNAAGKKVTCPRIPFRLKCEVFDQYYFSINPDAANIENIETLEKHNPYRCFYLENGTVVGIVMINDPENAKRYEQAVRERWTADKL
jgi:NAD(P)H-nitrite reductase large subunit